MKANKIQQSLSLIACVLLLLSMAIIRNHKVCGQALDSTNEHTRSDTTRNDGSGLLVINTTSIGKDITGYGGNVPLEITVKDGVIQDVKALENQESPSFFEKASALLDKWKGKRVAEAMDMQVDAVSGATFSSKAIIGNMQRGLRMAAKAEAAKPKPTDGIDMKAVAALFVTMMAAVLPLFVKNRRYNMAQMVLNVVVLGFWCGQFLSYSSIINFISNGITGWSVTTIAVMLVTAFVYPLFGKKSFYCAHVCPMGAMQQLVGVHSKHLIHISASTLRRLDIFRQVLWAMLMLFVWSSVWAEWLDYELFTAFIVQSAALPVVGVAVAFIVLSVFVQRPFCRFVCPMGTLFKLSQTSK